MYYGVLPFQNEKKLKPSNPKCFTYQCSQYCPPKAMHKSISQTFEWPLPDSAVTLHYVSIKIQGKGYSYFTIIHF
jgi:hypothetical protein